jgi:hypothetical protein
MDMAFLDIIEQTPESLIWEDEDAENDPFICQCHVIGNDVMNALF